MESILPYVLLVTLWSGTGGEGGVHHSAVEFTSKETCMVAARRAITLQKMAFPRLTVHEHEDGFMVDQYKTGFATYACNER